MNAESVFTTTFNNSLFRLNNQDFYSVDGCFRQIVFSKKMWNPYDVPGKHREHLTPYGILLDKATHICLDDLDERILKSYLLYLYVGQILEKGLWINQKYRASIHSLTSQFYTNPPTTTIISFNTYEPDDSDEECVFFMDKESQSWLADVNQFNNYKYIHMDLRTYMRSRYKGFEALDNNQKIIVHIKGGENADGVQTYVNTIFTIKPLTTDDMPVMVFDNVPNNVIVNWDKVFYVSRKA